MLQRIYVKREELRHPGILNAVHTYPQQNTEMSVDGRFNAKRAS